MKLIQIKKGDNSIVLDSKDAELDVFLVGFNGGNLNLKLNITKEHDDVSVYGIIIADKNKTYKINTISSHKAPNTKSRLHIKTIALDKAKFEFTGMINIEQNAQLSDAYLKNDNLVLSEDAKIDSSPQLEIKADDVKASHGVSITRVSEEELLYLRSRGLSLEESRSMIVYGFLNDLIYKLHSKEYDSINNKVLSVLSKPR